jgi:hypothetical protein
MEVLYHLLREHTTVGLGKSFNLITLGSKGQICSLGALLRGLGAQRGDSLFVETCPLNSIKVRPPPICPSFGLWASQEIGVARPPKKEVRLPLI